MAFEVREAVLEDGTDLIDLWHGNTDRLSEFDERYDHKESADERWLSYFENQLIDSKYGVVFVAERPASGELIGVLEGRVMGNHPIFRLENHGYVNGLYVDTENLQAVGGELLEAVQAWFSAPPREVDFFRVDVIDGDKEMAQFYEQAGLSIAERVYEIRDV